MKFLALSVIALSSFALADTIDYSGAGSLAQGTATVTGSIAAGKTWEVADQLAEIDNVTTGMITSGNLGVIDLTTGTLAKCSVGLCFSGGTLDIDGLNDQDLFFSHLESGAIMQSGGFSILSATLVNGAVVTIKNPNKEFSTQAIITQGGGAVPEPATLGLVGTGLLSLGFLKRWIH